MKKQKKANKIGDIKTNFFSFLALLFKQEGGGNNCKKTALNYCEYIII